MNAPVAAGARITPLRPRTVPDRRDWTGFLEEQLPPDWLPGEWDPRTGNLTPLPDTGRFGVVTCARAGCNAVIEQRKTCERCIQSDQSGANDVRPADGMPRATSGPYVRLDCVLTKEGIRCGRNQLSHGLCRSHYTLYRASKTHNDVKSWLASTTSKPKAYLPCAARGCPVSAENPRVPLLLCTNHSYRLRAKQGRGDIVDEQGSLEWLADPTEPRVILRIGRLGPRLQAELRYVIQAHLSLGRSPLQVSAYRDLINKAIMWNTTSLAATIAHPGNRPRSNSRSVHHFITKILDREERRHAGSDPHSEDLIYLGDLNLRITASARRETFQKPPLDLRRITQPWLREGYRNWLLTALPRRGDAQTGYRITVLAAQVLGKGPDRGNDPRALGPAHMSAIINAMNRQWPRYGGAKGAFRIWRHILDTGHRTTIWNEVPRGFSYNPRIHKPPTHPSTFRETGTTGRAIPAAAVAHLRNNLHALTMYANRDMAIAILAVLIDTGRRPSEVASLRRDCLQRDRHGDWILLYDNHKAGRPQRRLPIQQETANAITGWLATPTAARASKSRWLFPSPMKARTDHPASYGLLHGALRRLIRDVQPLQGPVKDLHGTPVDFTFAGLRPHDFRHSYAQRHVDNGTAPDELRDLLDHDDVRTTMGYYQVNDRRKRAAADLLAPLTYDRAGERIGMAAGRRAMASVAVPYGGCTEPSNVKAGGTSCPIRFQCSGCTFYRPDPSYLPDIERHLVELKTNAAQARRLHAPPYAIANFEGQVEDFQRIVDRMRADLALLPESQQTAIRTASAVLRSARLIAKPGQHLPLSVKDPQ
ncbi:tyrosine-type recombinase/integrase [Arthrobacter sp. KNU-44]|uniref:tyrosine-type recombinase/integrase n=1 Tax=Arthrobacter sp. KNU-44 TaxID=3450744 RepID=UPI003F432254